jgi:hypothetical protein
MGHKVCGSTGRTSINLLHCPEKNSIGNALLYVKKQKKNALS